MFPMRSTVVFRCLKFVFVYATCDSSQPAQPRTVLLFLVSRNLLLYAYYSLSARHTCWLFMYHTGRVYLSTSAFAVHYLVLFREQ
ncbi:hypothetical protein CPB85DRAFT_388212 [Mucidula mucida]|nr:hypothetical protein CPB85DRAFT_388212 [Mucidula mucida]